MQIIASLPDHLYHKQPMPGSWSVAQAANHIFLSEQFSLSYLKKKLSYPDTLTPFQLKSWGSVLILKLALITSYKAKAPKIINMWDQQPILSPGELDVKWNLLRTELFAFIEKHQPAFGSHLVYKHPFAGRLTMYQMLMFLNDHMAHHIRQIKTIQKKNHLVQVH
jgi:hypothetical protein